MNFRQIFDRSEAIGRKAEQGQATARDIAELGELYQQAIDLLDELMDTPATEPDLIVRIDGQTAVKFTDAEGLAKWITGVIHG